MTSNLTVDRLRDVNDKWLERKVTCQVCGGRRLVNTKAVISQHVLSGIVCSGGNTLPLEKDVALAESQLEKMKSRLNELSSSAKGSVARKIKALENRIGLYQKYDGPVGDWQLSTAFCTECAEQVELLSHEFLVDRLDKSALFGEVYCCSVSVATEAIEAPLSQLQLLDSAIKETQL